MRKGCQWLWVRNWFPPQLTSQHWAKISRRWDDNWNRKFQKWEVEMGTRTQYHFLAQATFPWGTRLNICLNRNLSLVTLASVRKLSSSTFRWVPTCLIFSHECICVFRLILFDQISHKQWKPILGLKLALDMGGSCKWLWVSWWFPPGTSVSSINNNCRVLPRIWKQGVKIEDFFKFRGSKVSYPIYKNDHSNLIYWLSKTKCASLCHLIYLLSSRSETFEIFPWTQTNTENLAKYNWVSFSQKSCVWESKWLPSGCLGKSLNNWPITI